MIFNNTMEFELTPVSEWNGQKFKEHLLGGLFFTVKKSAFFNLKMVVSCHIPTKCNLKIIERKRFFLKKNSFRNLKQKFGNKT